MKNILRTFIALWYLLGWLSHVYLALKNPQLYGVFGSTALIPGYATFWRGFIMPNIPFFAFLLAGFEIMVGLALISKGHWVKIGLIFSLLFNLFLIQMGLGMPADPGWQDFIANRLPNFVFILLQLPLLWTDFPQSIIELLKMKIKKSTRNE